MKERPILFSGPMVRAEREGRKTQTRRVVKGLGSGDLLEGVGMYEPLRSNRYGEAYPAAEVFGCWGDEWDVPCPYGKPGDRLWVKETFHGPRSEAQWRERIHPMDNLSYRATDGEFPAGSNMKWRPSIFMPRWASRTTLEVTAVRVERLQEISEEDAKAEGLDYRLDGPDVEFSGNPSEWRWNPVQAFRDLWESINGAGSWDANPFVWVIEFRRIQ